jgi:hypothetical protein
MRPHPFYLYGMRDARGWGWLYFEGLIFDLRVFGHARSCDEFRRRLPSGVVTATSIWQVSQRRKRQR